MAKRNPIIEDLLRIGRELAILNSSTIYVGIQGDEDSETLMIAGIQEYGATFKMSDKMRRYLGAMGLFDDSEEYQAPVGQETGYINIPERSFIRAGEESDKQGRYLTVKMAADHIVYDGWTAQQALDYIGAYCVQMLQTFIDEGKVQPPVSPFTQAQKTQYTTLYQTGTHIRDRITCRIETRGA